MKRVNISSITYAGEVLYRRAILDLIRNYQGEVIVDLGSGDGRFSRQMKMKMNASKLVCIDYDKKLLSKARSLGADTRAADLNNKIKLKSGSADVVVANQVIEHISKTDNLILEAKRILKSKGIFIVCTPNLASWHNILALVAGWQPFSSQVSDKYFVGNPLHPEYMNSIQEEQAHLRLFTKKSLVELGEVHGFELHKYKAVGFYPFSGILASIAVSILGKYAAYLLAVFKKKE